METFQDLWRRGGVQGLALFDVRNAMLDFIMRVDDGLFDNQCPGSEGSLLGQHTPNAE